MSACWRCHGSGEVETGAEPGCRCPMHSSAGGAECYCMCDHASDECPVCGGTGEHLRRDPWWQQEEPPQTRWEMTRGFGWY